MYVLIALSAALSCGACPRQDAQGTEGIVPTAPVAQATSKATVSPTATVTAAATAAVTATATATLDASFRGQTPYEYG